MSKILVRLSFITIALVVWSVTSTPAYADSLAQIKERQELMKSIGGKMKAIGGILKGKGDATSIGAHTAELACIIKESWSCVPSRVWPRRRKNVCKTKYLD